MTAPDRAGLALPMHPSGFLRHFARHYRWSYLASFTFETLASLSGIMLPWALSQVIRGVMAGGGASGAGLDPLPLPLLAFVGLVLAETVFGRLADGVQVRVRPRLRQHVVSVLYRYLQPHSQRFFSDNFAGSLAHRINEAAQGVAQMTWSLLTEFWPIVVVLATSLILLARVHPGLGLFFLAWVMLFVGLSYWFAGYARPWARQAAAARSETNGRIVDAIANQQSVRLFARLDHERALLDDSQQDELAIILLANRHAERVRWFQFGFAALLKGGTLWYGLHLWARGAIGVPEFVLATSLSFLIINETRNLSRRFQDLFESYGNVANALATIVQPYEVSDLPEARPLAIGPGRIEFRAVDFAYRPGQGLFSGLSVTIPAGQKVGLVGYSGSGKSTFVNLILRQFDPQSGSVCIDGTDIRAMDQASLHAQVGLIPQDPSLFHRSLRENIRYGRPGAGDDEVAWAAQRACADEFIAALPEGYDALVGERGVKLSGGQRQRIAIARVLLKDAPILILDEATSSLDSVTERAIQAALDRDMQGKTVVVVAHRLSTIAHLDRILVFDRGRIVEDGSHQELLGRDGVYRDLWRRQADGFLPGQPAG